MRDREFTDLDIPRGFGPDLEYETIARRGLARLYWTLEMGVREMRDQIAELPMAGAKETAEIVRNWSNDKAFQVGMHVVRGNLTPAEARTALSNLADASIATVLAAVVDDFAERAGPLRGGGVAAVCLGDLASRQVFPGAAVEMLFVHEGLQAGESATLYRGFRGSLGDLAQDSLLFSPLSRDRDSVRALPLSDLAEHCGSAVSDGPPVVAGARSVFECGDVAIGRRFETALRELVDDPSASEPLIARLREPFEGPAAPGVSTYARMPGGLDDVERASKFLRLSGAGLDDPAPTAEAVFRGAGADGLADAAALWRDLQGVTRLIGEAGFDVSAAGPRVRSVVANACGHEDFDALQSAVVETASDASARIDALLSRTHEGAH